MYLPFDTYSLPEVVFLCECADKNLSRIEKEPRSTFLYFSALFAFAMPWGIWFSDYFLIHPWQIFPAVFLCKKGENWEGTAEQKGRHLSMKNEKAMYALSYGLFILTARQGEKDNGCIINTVGQVTITPNRVTVAVDKSNLTHDMVLTTGEFTVSILSEEAKFDLFQRFGFQSGRDVDKFAGFAGAKRGENGILYVTQGINAYLTCKVVSATDLGTHTLFLAEVTDGDVLSDAPSATYAYYQAHIKPKPQAPAEKRGKKRWVCKVCGFIYEGDALPADYICPLWKHPASDFEPME